MASFNSYVKLPEGMGYYFRDYLLLMDDGLWIILLYITYYLWIMDTIGILMDYWE